MIAPGSQRMNIETATFLDLNALGRLERACFGPDAWPFLDLIAVLTLPDVIRLKVVEGDVMIAFAAGDPRPAQGFSMDCHHWCGSRTPAAGDWA